MMKQQMSLAEKESSVGSDSARGEKKVHDGSKFEDSGMKERKEINKQLTPRGLDLFICTIVDLECMRSCFIQSFQFSNEVSGILQ